LISHEKEVDDYNKFNNYLKITGIINYIFRQQKTLKKIRIKFYNILALPALLHGSENWTFKTRDARRRITAGEIKYMRKTAGYTWTYYKRNTEIAKELNLMPVLDKIQDCRRNWLQHANRMDTTCKQNDRNRLPRIMKTAAQTQKETGETIRETSGHVRDWNGSTNCPAPR